MMRAACLRDRFPPTVIHPMAVPPSHHASSVRRRRECGQVLPYASSEAVRAFTLKFEPKVPAKPPRRLGIRTTWSEKTSGAHV